MRYRFRLGGDQKRAAALARGRQSGKDHPQRHQDHFTLRTHGTRGRSGLADRDALADRRSTMKMFAYRGKHENFGDELNHWLWERLLPGFFDDDESQLFLGIGSILYDNFDPNMQKIVFGSGYGGYTNPP